MKMRKIFAFTAAAAIFAALGFSAEAARAAEAPLAGDKKALVVYFSKTGNTQGVAETVAKLSRPRSQSASLRKTRAPRSKPCRRISRGTT